MIFPGAELISAIEDQDDENEDGKRLLHVEALLHEMLDNVRKEIVKRETRINEPVLKGRYDE